MNNKIFVKNIKLSKRKVLYIRNLIKKNSVFDSESRFQEGINRFINIFYLSEEPVYKKLLIFLYLPVIFNIFWSFYISVKNETLRTKVRSIYHNLKFQYRTEKTTDSFFIPRLKSGVFSGTSIKKILLSYRLW